MSDYTIFFRGFVMAYSKISVTVPDEILDEVKRMAADRDIKISRLITEALAEKVKKAREESFVLKINKIFEDTNILKEKKTLKKGRKVFIEGASKPQILYFSFYDLNKLLD